MRAVRRAAYSAVQMAANSAVRSVDWMETHLAAQMVA